MKIASNGAVKSPALMLAMAAFVFLILSPTIQAAKSFGEPWAAALLGVPTVTALIGFTLALAAVVVWAASRARGE